MSEPPPRPVSSTKATTDPALCVDGDGGENIPLKPAAPAPQEQSQKVPRPQLSEEHTLITAPPQAGQPGEFYCLGWPKSLGAAVTDVPDTWPGAPPGTERPRPEQKDHTADPYSAPPASEQRFRSAEEAVVGSCVVVVAKLVGDSKDPSLVLEDIADGFPGSPQVRRDMQEPEAEALPAVGP